MRPGMRPPFAPRGPPFDPREADPFFRPPFDEMRGRPGPHIRPPFGPIGPPAMHGPDGLWRNQESGGGPPSASWSGQDPDGHGRENHLPSRDKQKLLPKHQDYKNISENRNRNRKSRWGNVSPPLMDDEVPPSEDVENKTKAFADGVGELETKSNFDTSSSTVDQHDILIQREQELTARERDDGENELGSISNDEGNRETGYRNDENRANLYKIDHVDHFPNDDLALKQQEQCEYEAPIPAENSAQQSAVQPIEQIGHLSENHSDQSVEQQVNSL